MKKKKHIDSYELMYPVQLVIANEQVTLKDLQKLFVFCDGRELTDDILDGLATTTRVKDKKTGVAVSLIKISGIDRCDADSKNIQLSGIATHEAIHAALDIYDRIGETVSNMHQETFAYFVEYITRCILKTINKK